MNGSGGCICVDCWAGKVGAGNGKRGPAAWAEGRPEAAGPAF